MGTDTSINEESVGEIMNRDTVPLRDMQTEKIEADYSNVSKVHSCPIKYGICPIEILDFSPKYCCSCLYTSLEPAPVAW